MALRLPDKWLWDFWLVQDGSYYHIFYLQASRALLKEELRHWHTSIGHAVSEDLTNWEILPDALHPQHRAVDDGMVEPWDNYTVWTGSIIRHQGLWYQFYTGSRRMDNGLVQRVGLATSKDLINWERYSDKPLVEADPTWYELLDLDLWHDQAWRDPWVVQHPQTGEFHMFLTARVKHGTPMGRGVVGHAKSTDLLTWEVLPPLTEPGRFGQLEVPQLVTINHKYYMVFSTTAEYYSPHYIPQHPGQPVSGTHYMVADDILGPYRFLTDEFLFGDTYLGTLYSGKLIQGPDDQWYFLAFRNFSPVDEFIGELHDPIPVMIMDDGRLRLAL